MGLPASAQHSVPSSIMPYSCLSACMLLIYQVYWIRAKTPEQIAIITWHSKCPQLSPFLPLHIAHVSLTLQYAFRWRYNKVGIDRYVCRCALSHYCHKVTPLSVHNTSTCIVQLMNKLAGHIMSQTTTGCRRIIYRHLIKTHGAKQSR